MRKFLGPVGSVSRVTIESRALERNMLGDPTARVVDIYIPAGHDGEGLPLLVDLVGFSGSGLSHTNWIGFRENLPERLDRLIGEDRMPPVVVAFPDCLHGLAATSTSTRRPSALGKTSCCMKCCRRLSSVSAVAALDAVACSERVLAATAR